MLHSVLHYKKKAGLVVGELPRSQLDPKTHILDEMLELKSLSDPRNRMQIYTSNKKLKLRFHWKFLF